MRIRVESISQVGTHTVVVQGGLGGQLTRDFLRPVASRDGWVVVQAVGAGESELGAIYHAIIVDSTVSVTTVKSNARALKVVVLKISGAAHFLDLINELLLVSLCFNSSNNARNLTDHNHIIFLNLV